MNLTFSGTGSSRHAVGRHLHDLDCRGRIALRADHGVHGLDDSPRAICIDAPQNLIAARRGSLYYRGIRYTHIGRSDRRRGDRDSEEGEYEPRERKGRERRRQREPEPPHEGELVSKWKFDPETRTIRETAPDGTPGSTHRTFDSELDARRALEEAITRSKNLSEGQAREVFPLGRFNERPANPADRIPSRPDTTHHIGQIDQHGSYRGTVWRNVYIAPDGTKHVYYTYSIGGH